MGKYKNVSKANTGSVMAGVKPKFYFKERSAFSACPEFKTTQTAPVDFSTLEGDFTFVDPADKWNSLEFMIESGELKWTKVGSKGNSKSKLDFGFSVASTQDALYMFLEKLNLGEDIIIVLDPADCKNATKYMFGGCCYPATIESYEGTLGKTGEDDVKTDFMFKAYAPSLPPKLPSNITFEVEEAES